MALFAELGKINYFSGKPNKLCVKGIKNSENLPFFFAPENQN